MNFLINTGNVGRQCKKGSSLIPVPDHLTVDKKEFSTQNKSNLVNVRQRVQSVAS